MLYIFTKKKPFETCIEHYQIDYVYEHISTEATLLLAVENKQLRSIFGDNIMIVIVSSQYEYAVGTHQKRMGEAL